VSCFDTDTTNISATLVSFFNEDISQGNLAKRLKSDGIFSDHVTANFIIYQIYPFGTHSILLPRVRNTRNSWSISESPGNKALRVTWTYGSRKVSGNRKYRSML